MSPNTETAISQPKLSRREQKAATRITIKNAARRAFFELGYNRAGIADIARFAGVAHGTFYIHFANKGGLLDELLIEFNDGLAQRLQPILAAPGAPLADTVRGTAEIFLDYWHAHQSFVECYAQRSAAGIDPTSLRDGVNPPMTRLLSVALEMTATRRGIAGGNWELVTQGLLALWLRIGMQYLFNEPVSRDAAIETLVTMTIGAVGALLPEA